MSATTLQIHHLPCDAAAAPAPPIFLARAVARKPCPIPPGLAPSGCASHHILAFEIFCWSSSALTETIPIANCVPRYVPRTVRTSPEHDPQQHGEKYTLESEKEVPTDISPTAEQGMLIAVAQQQQPVSSKMKLPPVVTRIWP